jgi:hypothetical protein
MKSAASAVEAATAAEPTGIGRHGRQREGRGERAREHHALVHLIHSTFAASQVVGG